MTGVKFLLDCFIHGRSRDMRLGIATTMSSTTSTGARTDIVPRDGGHGMCGIGQGDVDM